MSGLHTLLLWIPTLVIQKSANPVLVAYACNPAYLAAEVRRIVVQDPSK
jgi:hypothetical protein